MSDSEFNSVLTVKPDVASGKYRTVLEWLFGPGKDRYGSAGNAMHEAVKAFPEFQAWLQQRTEASATSAA